ncbi:MAG TPA: Gfo/Idh/MocA family oxidoreductase [Verrucomicrobiota bacterium]|jgi:predicted dehydrogenase|nr:Gfo/Idh/MocA family oxidoreductase [Verrucomicrobiota bacterium]
MNTSSTIRTPRRQFIKSSSASISALATVHLTSGLRAASPNDKVSLGIIGPGGMGRNHIGNLNKRKDVHIAFVCDPDSNHQAKAANMVESGTGIKPKQLGDLREMLEVNSVDAVFIATPDHWHAPAAILAAEAGKHVYVEKPCSHNVREGRLMIEAARRNRRVMQVGTQSRSTRHVQRAMELLHNGAIGRVLVAKAWNSQKRSSIGKAKPGAPPAHLDFDTWLGPAPKVSYQSNMLHGIWRWWHAFGTGDMGNDGVHDLDIARWGLGVTTHPSRIAALGGKYFFDDDQQFPDTQNVLFEYEPDTEGGRPRQLIFEQRIWAPYFEQGYENGDAFYGTDGIMLLGKHGGWKLFGPRNKLREQMSGSPDLRAHHDDFFRCIREGSTPNADIEIGHLSSSLCHLGNIATRVGRVLEFDPKREQIVGDNEANALVTRKYSDHWSRPNGV